MKIKKKKFGREDVYIIISIVAVILVISFALNAVHTTEAALNNIEPTGMASLSSEKIEENKVDMEPILIKNGTIWQLNKLKLNQRID